MSLQGPIVVVAETPAAGLVQAFTEAGAFPVMEVRWAQAPGAIASIKPSAVVIAEPGSPNPKIAEAIEEQLAASETYTPIVAFMRDDDEPTFPDAVPIDTEAGADLLIKRVSSALRLRSLHATVLGRARSLRSARNIVAEVPQNDPVEDATVLVVGRGRMHPALSVAVGERMGVVGAMSVELAARCLNARDFDGVVIGDGLSPKMVVSLLVAIGEDPRFRELPVAMLGPEERIEELPNLVHARDPHRLVERLIPMVRHHAFEQQLKRLLKSIETKGMIDARTGLLGADAFGHDLSRAIDDACERGVALSLARFSFDETLDLRTSMDAARLVGRLIRDIDFAHRQDDGSIVTAFTGTDLRAAHVVARRLASVIRHTLLRADRQQAQATVTLATLKPGDTPLTLMSRVAPRPVAAE
jgi:hypothetical protein